MTGTITRTGCPECSVVGYLYLTSRFIAKPIGEFSLAGAQMKVSGTMKPVLKCHNCSLDIVGEYDDDNHATFATPKEEGNEASNV